MRRLSLLSLLVFAVAASAQVTPDATESAAAAAPAPSTIAFQGTLTDNGTPVTDGTYTVLTRLYDVASGGTALYAEEHSVTTSGGAFALSVGGGAPTSGSFASVNFSEAVWVEVVWDGTTLSPRTAVEPAPTARTLVAEATVAGGGTWALRGDNTATLGFGYGVYGRSASPLGTGVYGEIDANSGTGSGVRGVSRSQDGRGVLGEATATSGNATGVRGQSASSGGYGVYGTATAATGSPTGVYGTAAVSPTGIGVFGRGNTGVQGQSTSTAGRGVSGSATAETGTTYGVLGESRSADGYGVHGRATADFGTAVGVYGTSDAFEGRGVHGASDRATGTTYGIYGSVVSPDGHAGYFEGGPVHVDYASSSARPHLLLDEATTTGFARLGFQNANANSYTWTVASGGADGGTFNLFTRGRNVVLFKADADDGGTDPDLIRTSANGASLTQGGVWTNASSRAFKTDFLPVDPEAVLTTLATVPVTRWRYRTEADDVWHLGPVSQDFHAAFGLGSTDEAIGTVDADGVALAAAQALAARTDVQQARIDALLARLDAVLGHVETLEDRVAHLEAILATAPR